MAKTIQCPKLERIQIDLHYSPNPLIQKIRQAIDKLTKWKEKARGYYFEVLFSTLSCPLCGGRLHMIDGGMCKCTCGNRFDPTLAFQKCANCGAELIKKTFHYACTECQKPAPSRFHFDEKVFDRQYFREMMRESRDRAQKRREEIRRLLAETRSGSLPLTEAPDLESIPGLIDDLAEFIRMEPGEPCGAFFDETPLFNMEKYRAHILSALGWDIMRFSDLTPMLDDSRKDRAYRFVTLVFMENDRQIDIEQDENDLFIQRVYNEAHC